MQIKDIMTPAVEVIYPNSTLTEAAGKMRSLNVGSLPVCDLGWLIGMITDRDITIRATAEGLDPNTTLVRDCMSDALVFCFDDQTPQDAARLMQMEQVRRLPVITRAKELVGIIALADLATKADTPRGVGTTLEKVSTPAGPTP